MNLGALELPIQHSRRTAPAGSIVSAFRAPAISFVHPKHKKVSAAKKLGIAFEKRAYRWLRFEIEKFEAQPHFRFQLAGHSPESCFPDALITRGNVVTIVEIKLRHTYDGYFQLTRLYYPVVQHAFRGCEVRRLEIVKSYDPGVTLPEQVDVVGDLRAWLASPRVNYGILILGRTGR